MTIKAKVFKVVSGIMLSLLIAVTVSAGVTFRQSTTGEVSVGNIIPAGAIIAFGGTTAPTAFLMCDGTSYLRATYPNLATALGCSGATCAYGAADSTHFNVPDLRGRFLRGTDGGATRDPDRAARSAMATGGNTGDAVGSVQTSANMAHQHSMTYNYQGASNGTQAFLTSVAAGGGNITLIAASAGSTEARPTNANVNYIIKY